jgi:sec-independent protein translocase protein TatB
MFDLTSGKLLLLGIVALIVLGPKDFPILLRTIGKYMGIIKRQADEFRDQFNDAIRESEFDQIKKDIEGLGQDVDATMRETQNSITKEMDGVSQEFDSVRTDIDAQLADPLKPSPHTDSYTPLGLDEPVPVAGGDPASPDPDTPKDTTSAAVPDPDAHDANGMPFAGPGEPEPEREHATVPAERNLNGSGAHAEPPRAAPEPAPKSGA